MSEEYEDTKEEHYVALYIIFDIQQADFLHSDSFAFLHVLSNIHRSVFAKTCLVHDLERISITQDIISGGGKNNNS